MGLFSNTIKTVFKADTSQARREMKKLSGDAKKAMKEQVAAIEDGNAKLDAQIGRFEKVVGGIAAIGGAWLTAKASFEAYTKTQTLRANAGSADIDRLRKASRGLLTEVQLLEFAVQAQGSAFGATQDEMETVLRNLPVLASKGHETTRAFEALKKATVEANAEGLKEFGINIKAQSDTVEGFNSLLGGLSQNAKAAGENLSIAGESMLQASVAMDDSMNNLKVSIGEMVDELSPALDLLAGAVDLLTDAVGAMRRGLEAWLRVNELDTIPGVVGIRKGSAAATLDIATKAGAGVEQKRLQRILERGARQQDSANARTRFGGRRGSRGRGPDPFDLGELGEADLRDPFDQVVGLGGETQEGRAQLLADLREIGSVQSEIAKRPNVLESMFGPMQTINGYQTALDGLTGSMQAGLRAWIDGSESFASAFKKALGDAIASLASQMLAESLKHAAYALGSLAFGDARGAAQHGAAAAAFGAGAATAAGVARAMGGAGNTPAAGGGLAPVQPGTPAGPVASGPGGGGSSVTVFVGNDFAQGDRRQQQQRLAKILQDIDATQDQVVFR